MIKTFFILILLSIWYVFLFHFHFWASAVASYGFNDTINISPLFLTTVKHLSLTGWQMWDPLIAHCCSLPSLHRRRLTPSAFSTPRLSEWIQMSWSSFFKYPVGLHLDSSIFFILLLSCRETPSIKSIF